MRIEKPGGNPFHRNWRTWVIVGFALMAMGLYLFNLDESIPLSGQSGGGSQVGTAPSKP